MADWRPLAELFPGSEARTLPPAVPAPVVAPAAFISSPKNSGLAIASLVCGALSFPTCGLTGLPGVICGHMALSSIRKSMGAIGGKGFAITGLVMSYCGFLLIGLSVLAGLAFPTFARIQEKGMQTKSISHAKQIVVACRLYASDHAGKLPDDLESLLKAELIPEVVLRDPLLHDNTQIGYEYYGAGMKDTDQPDTVILKSKSSDSRGRGVVARMDGSVEVDGSSAHR